MPWTTPEWGGRLHASWRDTDYDVLAILRVLSASKEVATLAAPRSELI